LRFKKKKIFCQFVLIAAGNSIIYGAVFWKVFLANDTSIFVLNAGKFWESLTEKVSGWDRKYILKITS